MDVNEALVKKILAVIDKYQEKDYFWTTQSIRLKIEERDRRIAKGETELAKKFPDSLIRETIVKNVKAQAFNRTFKHLQLAINDKCIDRLSSKVRYDQQMTCEMFTIITGIKLKKTNKAIRIQLQNFCNN